MLNRRGFVATVSAVFLPAPAFADADWIRLRELYNRDQSISDRAVALEGQRVKVEGYMAPLLQAEARFFVLTRRPMLVCPFCESDADWPDSILAVYTKRAVRITAFDDGITVSGRLELGVRKDPITGFLSRVRITDATYR